MHLERGQLRQRSQLRLHMQAGNAAEERDADVANSKSLESPADSLDAPYVGVAIDTLYSETFNDGKSTQT